ncbi:MAG: hypothetical protein N838_29570 [Thiohalocapsa sp. PB-PSB1]|nr:MAG: hypothetical protein N838_29570 [Thiohalocapsa sp. PB-PSB1]
MVELMNNARPLVAHVSTIIFMQLMNPKLHSTFCISFHYRMDKVHFYRLLMIQLAE